MKKYLGFYSITGLLFFAYLFTRAITVGVTYDEAWTLMDFVPIDVWHILNCTPCDANNHIVNTLLIKLVYLFSPDTLFWGRLPNLAAAVLYFVIGAKIGKHFLPKYLGYAFFLLLLANPFLMDFFSLARGYGLAVAFMLCSVHSLLHFRENGKQQNAAGGLGWASVAVLCNYALLNYWFGALFAVFLLSFRPHKTRVSLLKVAGIGFLFSVALLAIMYEPIRKLVAQDGLYYGGKHGFYNETVGSLVRYGLYDPYAIEMSYAVANVLTACLLLLMIASIITFGSLKDFIFSRVLLITFLVGIPILSNIMQHILLDTLYLISRTALFYYPLFILLVAFWASAIKIKKLQWTGQILVGLLALAFGWNFLRNANFHKTITWEFDAHNREILQNLQAKAEGENTIYSVGAVRLYIRGILYQINDFPNLTYMPEQTLKDSVATDYYLYYNKDLPRIGYFGSEQKINNYRRDTVLQFPEEKVYVFTNFRKKFN